jgi:alpha-1,3-rhamnosyl/mannosyltransferase
MRVIVNEVQMLKQRTGIGHYTAELLRSMRSIAVDDQVDGFPAGQLRRLTAACFRAASSMVRATAVQRDGCFSRLRSRTLGLLRDGVDAVLTRRFARQCAVGAYDLYHEPNFLPMPTDCPTLATWHDLSVLLHPQWHPVDRVRRFEKQLPDVLARCCHFLADTDSVRREAVDVLGVGADRVTRVYMGIRSDLRPLPCSIVQGELVRLGLPQQYLLFLGTIEPRKNILRLLQGYCSLPDSIRSDWPLVLAGGWGWNAGEIHRYLDDVARHRGVVHLGYVADESLPILYNGARALLFPSYYEGFGLPPLEMMACGGAVIASTADAVREVVGGQAHLIDPEDDDGWRRALVRVCTDDDWQHELRRGAEETARSFTWERCAAETLATYYVATGKRTHAPLQSRLTSASSLGR